MAVDFHNSDATLPVFSRLSRIPKNLSYFLVEVIAEAFFLNRKQISYSKFDKLSGKQFRELDWTSVKTQVLPASKHIDVEHTKFNPQKVKNGVFFGDAKEKINLAWEKAQKRGIEPISIKKGNSYFDHYMVPFESAGYEYAGGMAQNISQGPLFSNTICHYIAVVTESGTIG